MARINVVLTSVDTFARFSTNISRKDGERLNKETIAKYQILDDMRKDMEKNFI